MMKRFIVAFITLTIALASVCWAEDLDPTELTGMWQLESVNSEQADYVMYITARSDGAMTEYTDYGVAYNVIIGNWYKVTPDKYAFAYNFIGDDNIRILSLEDGKLTFQDTFNDETYLYSYIKIEEE